MRSIMGGFRVVMALCLVAVATPSDHAESLAASWAGADAFQAQALSLRSGVQHSGAATRRVDRWTTAERDAVRLGDPLTLRNAWRFPIQHDDALRQLLKAGIILTIPYVGWLWNLGYRVIMGRRLLNGETPWPQRGQTLSFLRHGLVTANVVGAYVVVPTVLLSSWPYVATAWALLSIHSFPALMIPYSRSFRLRDIMRLRNYAFMGSRDYWKAWLISWPALGLALLSAPTLFGFFVVNAWLYQVTCYSFGSAYARYAGARETPRPTARVEATDLIADYADVVLPAIIARNRKTRRVQVDVLASEAEDIAALETAARLAFDRHPEWGSFKSWDFSVRQADFRDAHLLHALSTSDAVLLHPQAKTALFAPAIAATLEMFAKKAYLVGDAADVFALIKFSHSVLAPRDNSPLWMGIPRDSEGDAVTHRPSYSDLLADCRNGLLEFADRFDISIHIEDLLAIPMEADYPGIVAYILSETLTNAVKYSYQGGRIDVTLIRNGPAALIQIIDRGIGILKEDLPFVTQGGGYRTALARAHITGNGKGLGTVDRLIRDMFKGSFDIFSAGAGQGTTVILQLPRIAA